MLIGHREFMLIDQTYEGIGKFVNEIGSYAKKMKIPEDFKVDVYKDQVVCCGIFPLGVIIDISGPGDHVIKDLDKMVYSKVIEICERDCIELHEAKPLEII